MTSTLEPPRPRPSGARSRARARRILRLALATCALLAGCDSSGSPAEPAAPAECGGYPPWRDSPLVLPYTPGTAHRVSQGNCTQFSHSGLLRYAYDFAMPIGTEVTASRSGTVVYLEEHWPDGDGTWYHSNLVRIRHADGTYALYAHLTTGGALVAVGDSVAQGEVIGLSGNSGYTLGLPHLHFQVAPCSFYEDCGTLPATFRNTVANPSGLVAGQTYTAFAD